MSYSSVSWVSSLHAHMAFSKPQSIGWATTYISYKYVEMVNEKI